MHRFVVLVFLATTAVQCFGEVQVQMPDAAELQEEDFQTQIKDLQKNVSDIWTYIHELRNAVSGHITHLRQHQVELETSMHKMEHLHGSELQSSSHHHSGEHHSHSGEQHSHSGEHSHGGDHSHSGEHSHGGDHSHSADHSHGGDHDHSHSADHSHSGEHHSHSGEHHSHSGEHHSHSGEHGHSSHSHSHSHTTHDHSKEESHSHGDDHQHDHKDSHETEDLQEQTQQAVDPPPALEPVVVASTRQEHHHHHHHRTQTSRPGDVDSMNLLNENNFHHHHHSHHHHHDSGDKNRSRTVELPKYSDYGLYDLALCDVAPNRAIPEDLQQNVGGTVTLWQKKTGGPLNVHVRLQGFNVGDHHEHHQSVQQEEDNETPQAVGHRHGFHVHTSGDLSNGCQSFGPHYNPKGQNHGGINALSRHVGDWGNIECDEHGITNILFSDNVASLTGPYSIVGRGIVIHANEDNLTGADGNAGTRIACCVIRKVDKIPIRQHKAMKSATQYQNN